MAYTEEQKQEKFDDIIKLISEDGLSLRKILKAFDMPSSQTFYKWLTEDEAKAKQYAYACEERADILFEEILEIADSEDDITYIDNKDRTRIDWGKVQRNKTQIDARKWMLSKLNPKKYGDKIQTDNTHKGKITIVRKVKK